MRSLFFTTILAVVSALASANDAFNDVTPAKTFKPVGDHNPVNVMKYTADPGVMVYNDTVYVYGTNDGIVEKLGENPGDNEYADIHSLNVMSSKDLVNWVDHGTIQGATDEGAAKWAGNSWAPAATYKKIDGKDKFFIYFANSGDGIGVLTSDSPTGPFVDPLGKALITRDDPNCADVTWLFDPAVFVDDDGTGYIYFGGGVPDMPDPNNSTQTIPQSEHPKTFRVAKLSDDMIHLASEPVVIDAPWGFEDSGIHKAGDTYYYTYCTNWDEKSPFAQARIGYMTSDSPLGPFTFQDTILNNPGDFFEVVGNNHHTVIPFHDKWYIFYHSEWLNLLSFGEKHGYRTTHVNELPFENGKFLNATGTLEGVDQLFNVNPYQVQPAALMAWAAGTSTNGLGHTTVTYNKGEWTGVSNVDFEDGADAIVITASTKEGAVIKITVDDVDGEVLGYVTIPATGELETVTADIAPVEGVKNVFFLASNDVTVDTWEFVKADEAATDAVTDAGEDLSEPEDVKEELENEQDSGDEDENENEPSEAANNEEPNEEGNNEAPKEEEGNNEEPEDVKEELENEQESGEEAEPTDAVADNGEESAKDDAEPTDAAADENEAPKEEANNEEPEDVKEELENEQDSGEEAEPTDAVADNGEESAKDDAEPTDAAADENEAPKEELENEQDSGEEAEPTDAVADNGEESVNDEAEPTDAEPTDAEPTDVEPTEGAEDNGEESENNENEPDESANDENEAPKEEKKVRKCVVRKKKTEEPKEEEANDANEPNNGEESANDEADLNDNAENNGEESANDEAEPTDAVADNGEESANDGAEPTDDAEEGNNDVEPTDAAENNGEESAKDDAEPTVDAEEGNNDVEPTDAAENNGEESGKDDAEPTDDAELGNNDHELENAQDSTEELEDAQDSTEE